MSVVSMNLDLHFTCFILLAFTCIKWRSWDILGSCLQMRKQEINRQISAMLSSWCTSNGKQTHNHFKCKWLKLVSTVGWLCASQKQSEVFRQELGVEPLFLHTERATAPWCPLDTFLGRCFEPVPLAKSPGANPGPILRTMPLHWTEDIFVFSRRRGTVWREGSEQIRTDKLRKMDGS